MVQGRKHSGPTPCPRAAWPHDHGSPFSLVRGWLETSPTPRCAYILLWKQHHLYNVYKGITNKQLFHLGRDHARPARAAMTFEPAICHELSKRPCQEDKPVGKASPKLSKELQIWVNQGTRCANLDFHQEKPGYGVDCWKPAQEVQPAWLVGQGKLRASQGAPMTNS